MKLVVFKAGDGDSLLVQGEQANILVDGGRKTQFRNHVAPALTALHAAQKKLDLVCVSHIDDDHITGIVELYRRRVEWAVHNAGGASEPDFDEPPVIERLWHNAFDTTVESTPGGGSSDISNQLGFHGQLITASSALAETAYGQRLGRIAQGARLAIELDLRFQQSPMNIEFNGPTDGELLQVGDDPLAAEDVNGVAVQILSPFQEDLVRLRGAWDKWVNGNKAKVQEMRDEFSAQSASTDALEFLRFAASQAELGAFDGITPPNLASITFLLEENGKTILMTGDHAAEGKEVDDDDPLKRGLLEGLIHAKRVDEPDGGLHVNVLKVPHHGATANTSVNFARRITADHYVFCANGRHHNPEIDVIEAYVASRLSDDDEVRSANPETDQSFKLWFNYHPDDDEIAGNQNFVDQMTAARTRVEELVAQHPGRFEFEFSQASSFTIDLG